MKSLLITGANGFIGKNLVAALERNEELQIFKYGKNDSFDRLRDYVEQADFVFHLAGVNRPKELIEFETGNHLFTNELLQIILASGKKLPVLMASSAQAALDNPYGASKKNAEKSLIRYADETGSHVFIYRLPNVFGKWCRPNYNSVVATWCHNISRGLPIQIHDPLSEMNLVYIDDVVDEFVNTCITGVQQNNICSYRLTLQLLADTLQAFKNSRDTLVLADYGDDLTKKLYSTYLSYLPEDEFAYELKMRHDNRGWLAEFVKSPSTGQIFISRTKPGITRGNHWHHTKVEKFLVIEGEAIIRFRQLHGDKIIEYPVSGEQLQVLDIPPGYTHSITNVGVTDVITIFWANEIFNPQKPDTYFLEV